MKLQINGRKILYFILIFGAIFMDCPTGIYFGVIGRCWFFIFVPFCFFLIVLAYKRIRINEYVRNIIVLVIWIAVISIISNIIQIADLGSTEYLGENLWFKSIKTITYWVVYIMYMCCILECIDHQTKKDMIFPFLIAYFFLFVVLILELRQIPYAFENLHFNTYIGYYTRVRLTTTESSLTVPLIVCYGLFSAYYAFYLSKSRTLKFLVLGTLIIFAVTSGSKTLFLMYAVGLIGIIWFNRKHIKKNMLFFFLGIIICAIMLIPMIVNTLQSEMLEMGESTATRSIQLIAAILHSIKFPFGNGGAAYMYSSQNMMLQVYEWIKQTEIGSQLKYTEILSQINSASDSFGVIAGFWQLTQNVGIIGAGYCLYSTWNYLKKLFHNYDKGVWILKVMILCILFMWLFTTTMNNVYFMWATILIVGTEQFIVIQSDLKTLS